LNYTRLEEVNRTEVVYDNFLKAAIAQFRQEFSDKVVHAQIRLSSSQGSSEQPIRLNLDRLLIRRVLFNILLNSIDACTGKGKIEIRFRRLPRQSVVDRYGERILLGLDETIVETLVSDTGPGISAENLEHIFAPFFTTKKEGSGLGLAVAWKIMKAHGGDIVAENGPEGGAVFRLLLPAKIEDAIKVR